jgi:PEP-CTERM motif
MKKTAILSGVIAAAVLFGTSAMAQVSYQNGDMLAAFGKSGSPVDVIVDLGSIAQFQQAQGPTLNFAGVSAALNSTFSGTAGVYWAVFGANDFNSPRPYPAITQGDANTIWATLARSNPNNQTPAPLVSGNSASQAGVLGDIQVMALLANGGTAISAGIVSAPSASELFGFTPQMTATSTSFNGDWSYNVLNTGAGTSDLYQSDPNSPSGNMAYLGAFSLDSSGAFNFVPVPEPSSIALLGAGLTSLLIFRRRKQ